MNRIRARWDESRQAINDQRVRVGAAATLCVWLCALVVIAISGNTYWAGFIGGMLIGLAYAAMSSLVALVTSVRKARNSEAMTLASSKMIAGFVAEELKDKGLDVEVTVGPEGIAVRKRDPAMTVH